MKTIIIEDQAPAQQILQRYISNTMNLTVERTFCDALQAKAYLAAHPVDLIFLDINLPRFSGMDFLKSEQGHPLTILTTAYPEYALESYQFKVVDYLLKPFSFERFSQAIQKVNAITESIKDISEATDASFEKHIYIKSAHDLIRVDKNEIICIKSDSDYTEVITPANRYLSSEALKDWMLKLDLNFKQVHKSYIVNTSHLKKISHNKIYLTMDQVIPIGRAYKKGFYEKIVK